MDLKEFVTNELISMGKDLEFVEPLIKDITEYARKKAVKNCAVIPDGEIKHFIHTYTFNESKTKGEKVEEKKEPKVITKNSKKDKDFEQVGLF